MPAPSELAAARTKAITWRPPSCFLHLYRVCKGTPLWMERQGDLRCGEACSEGAGTFPTICASDAHLGPSGPSSVEALVHFPESQDVLWGIPGLHGLCLGGRVLECPRAPPGNPESCAQCCLLTFLAHRPKGVPVLWLGRCPPHHAPTAFSVWEPGYISHK